MVRLVNDLLILSRADSKALGIRLAPTDSDRLFQEVVSRLTPLAKEKHVQIQIESDPDCPYALADSDRLEQVLLNVLDNAIKYSHGNGVVTAWVRGTGKSEVEIGIQDEGTGIPEEHLARIGERFYRADAARSRSQGGSGLGLAIAQTLIRSQGGRMRLESHEGQGTTVVIHLPAA
jgi:signal transduction histidine kinase